MARNKMDTWPETRWTHGQKQDGHMARNKMDTWPETRQTRTKQHKSVLLIKYINI
jgi:hypothetical protein